MDQSKGKAIIELFDSIRKIFVDISLIIEKFDDVFDDNGFKVKWGGSAITSDNSYSLNKPGQWLLEGIYRLYEKRDEFVYGFNISFKPGIQEPLLIAGKLEYKDPMNATAWEIWNLWYDDDFIDEKKFGEIYYQNKIDSNLLSCKFFAISLTSITDNERIEEIAKMIISL